MKINENAAGKAIAKAINSGSKNREPTEIPAESNTCSEQGIFLDEGCRPLVDAIIGSAPYDAAITIDLLPQPAINEVVMAIDQFVQELCRANSQLEDGRMMPLSINGFWLVQDLVRICSDDFIQHPMFRCIFLLSLDPLPESQKADLINTMVLPAISYDAHDNHFLPSRTIEEIEVIRNPAIVAEEFSSRMPFQAAPAVAIGCFDQNGILAHWIAQ